MKHYLLFALLLSVILTQQVIQNSIPRGQYRQIKKQSRDVPRYYLCGAGVWKRQLMVPQPNHCYTYCNKKRKWTGKTYCYWQTRCDPVPPKLAWIRANGIKFQYCHFQQWNQQMTLEESGNWDWQNMKMCPQNYYVYGARMKMTDRDGVAGLVLMCRSMKNVKETSQVLVFDGEGTWGNPIATANFAVGFKAKFHEGALTGLAFETAPTPYIFAFNLNYQFPKDFKITPQQIDNVVVYNFGPTQMRKEIELAKQKQFKRMWQNQRSELHGTFLSQMVSQSLSTTIKVGTPFLKHKKTFTTTESMTTASREQSMQSFKFGNVQTFKVSQKQRDVIFVPSCTKYIIRQIVYSANSDVPYILQIGYTNGIATEFDIINGWFRGVSVGEVETTINFQKIC